MVLNYIKSQSSIRPELVDSSSSKKVVYLRQNIVEVTTIDELSGEDEIYYEYEEAKLTKAEYKDYLNELEAVDVQQQRMDIEALQEENVQLREQLQLSVEVNDQQDMMLLELLDMFG